MVPGLVGVASEEPFGVERNRSFQSRQLEMIGVVPEIVVTIAEVMVVVIAEMIVAVLVLAEGMMIVIVAVVVIAEVIVAVPVIVGVIGVVMSSLVASLWIHDHSHHQFSIPSFCQGEGQMGSPEA